MFTGGAKRSLSSQKEMLITADEWEIPPEQVVIEGNIGEGAFGEVLKGVVKGPLSNPKVPRALKSSICIPVAIKMLKSKNFLSEGHIQDCPLLIKLLCTQMLPSKHFSYQRLPFYQNIFVVP